MSTTPAFLFDLDGTLVDSVYQHVLAWRDALESAGIELSVWRIHRRIGMSGGLLLNALLRETGLPVSDIAFRTGWSSLGTFGRVFREVTGAHPGQLRLDARAAVQAPGRVPGCVLGAAQRPDLESAVSEKRRQRVGGTTSAIKSDEVA